MVREDVDGMDCVSKSNSSKKNLPRLECVCVSGWWVGFFSNSILQMNATESKGK